MMSVKFVAYNPQSSTLRLQFDGGEVYDYHIVPPDEGRAAELALVGGNDGYFKASIKGIYPFTRVR